MDEQHTLSSIDGMSRARVDYKELVSKKSGFLNCFEEKPSAHCSVSALRLVRCVLLNSLIDERVKKRKCYASSTFLLLFHSFISFSRREKTNFHRTRDYESSAIATSSLSSGASFHPSSLFETCFPDFCCSMV